MSRALAAAALVAGVLAVREAAPVVMEGAPIWWTHTLNEQCTFDRRPWFEALPMGVRAHVRLRLGELPSEVHDEVMACQVRRGLKSETPLVKTLLRRWPNKAEMTAWRSAR